jgi:hypothetical protein
MKKMSAGKSCQENTKLWNHLLKSSKQKSQGTPLKKAKPIQRHSSPRVGQQSELVLWHALYDFFLERGLVLMELSIPVMTEWQKDTKPQITLTCGFKQVKKQSSLVAKKKK